MQICNPEGRDCIERNSAETFNCSTTCSGIYADVQWVGSDIEEEIKDETDELGDLKAKVSNDLEKRVALLERLLEKEITMKRRDVGDIVKNTLGKGVEEQDKMKYKMLISEYRKLKTKNVKHFKFNSAANLNTFGKYHFPLVTQL